MALLAGGEAAHCAGAVAASADSWRREQERKLTAFRERAERLRATALEAEQQRRALAERQRIEEELDRKYPWRKLLPPLESIDNWGDLRHKALDDEGLLTHRAEPEVGRAVRAAAERVRAARPKKWGSSSFGVDLMYTGIKSTPNDGRLHEQSGYHHLRARVAGTMGNRRPGTGHGNDTP
jgi:hypothetical protein